MRYSSEETAEKHERILDAAGMLFRSKGLSVNVRDIMAAAGLTHGAFYAHFDSKDALIAEIAERCVGETAALVATARDAPDPLAALSNAYLSREHRDHAEAGCAVAALGAELSRQTPESREGYTGKIDAIIDQIGALVDADNPKAARKDAIRHYALAVGALILARTVSRPDLSDEILDAARSGE
ncbi:MAG: TetR/AcrR family transcriptional regulator [Asticcacaulis sp.]|nr:TetR/AcrR family transcriptional regulator [Asticcacaulis sp.]